jgi:3',5'-cyclic AMP phosphodiesterase CpdA
LGRYRTLISATPDVAAVAKVAGLSVVGLNSTRSFALDGGSLFDEQLAWVEAQFAAAPRSDCRIVALHHHVLPDGGHQRPIRRAKHLLRRFAEVGVEMILVGHRHWARAERACEGLLIVQAGTATSRRGKGRDRGKNSYNVIEVDRTTIQVACHMYRADVGRFELVWMERFDRVRHDRPLSKPRGD